MCGRYSITKNPLELANEFGIPPVKVPPRYNVAPTQFAAVIWNEQKPALEFFRWGLIPHWAKDEAIGAKMINARAETLDQKVVYRSGLERRRCLVLADGFFEWKRHSRSAIPFRFVLRTGEPFAFAGLWDHWQRPDGTEIWSFTIVTTTPNTLVAEAHNRMPVILDQDTRAVWLDRNTPSQTCFNFLRPYPAEKMRSYRVNSAVNSVANDFPNCIEEAKQPLPEQLALL